jgi:hypothetical protein
MYFTRLPSTYSRDKNPGFRIVNQSDRANLLSTIVVDIRTLFRNTRNFLSFGSMTFSPQRLQYDP